MPLSQTLEKRWHHPHTWTCRALMLWVRRATKLHWPRHHCCLSSTITSARISNTCTSNSRLHQTTAHPDLKRLPQASHYHAARKLIMILERVTAANDVTSWMHLLNFSNHCLRVPRRGGQHWNLARLVNQQLVEDSDSPLPTGHWGSATRSTAYQLQDDPDTLQFVAARVSAKLEEGDFI